LNQHHCLSPDATSCNVLWERRQQHRRSKKVYKNYDSVDKPLAWSSVQTWCNSGSRQHCRPGCLSLPPTWTKPRGCPELVVQLHNQQPKKM
jgi:hypothetical protein